MFKLLSSSILPKLSLPNLTLVSLVISSLTTLNSAQAEEDIGVHDKGSFYAFWGWNRGAYSKSDVNLKGNNYDFTLNDITAADRPTTIGIDPYLNPFDITRPQTNVRIGYFFANNYSISFGVDHMKYVMNQNQSVVINGSINTGGEFDGTFNNELIDLSVQDVDDEYTFLTYEHTDGLNYINVEISRFDLLHSFNENIKLNSILGVGIGGLLPKTNAQLLHNERHDDFHWSGWGAHLQSGIEVTYKSFFIRSELKFGYIDMPDIRTTIHSSDRASQNFLFTEGTILLGSYF